MDLNRDQLDQVKQQLARAQQVSHFVIFETYDPTLNEKVRMVIDRNGYEEMKKARNATTPMKIIRDFVPVTDALARWAVAEHDAAAASMSGNGDVEALVQRMDECINEVLAENKLETNK
ncbi:hypothetical protein MOO44_03275 [Nicoliella spurrieriana]|uniref:Uncharacterized protein n=1 Tax=Nicoliella spurrieriana TaxID=2925830 RepID=A0A976X602_9LACO|nr:hypothetical protein [Nicoliella spurrieriana]UQS87196.1 hypothetical protein MOO44_03275 [Nicoliella spurrieriana]